MTYRKALVTRRDITGKQVQRYLPSNYDVIREVNENTVEIGGVDVAGWTMDEYIIPRLQTGLFHVQEVT